LSAACLALWQSPARGEFSLKGKTVTLYAGGGIGGGVDLYARTLAPYLGRHLPGEPAVVVSNMGGSGGVQGVQYLFNVAAKDGTAVGTTNSGAVSEPLMGQVKVAYQLDKFRWVGSLLRGNTVCGVWHTSSIKSIEDARQREVTLSATGATSGPARASLLLNALIGTKFRPIAGYPGKAMGLAVERGEVEGTCNTLSSLRTSQTAWLRERTFRLLLQVAVVADPDYPGVPRVVDLIKSPADRQLLDLYLLPYEFNNPFMLPPGTPDDVVATYRKAFTAAVRDPEYRADAAKRRQIIDPRDGDDVTNLVRQLLATPPDVVRRMLAVTDPRQQSGSGR
jgi:tripartite-type tricarboxylate transporter receptor subunit TctC